MGNKNNLPIRIIKHWGRQVHATKKKRSASAGWLAGWLAGRLACWLPVSSVARCSRCPLPTLPVAPVVPIAPVAPVVPVAVPGLRV